MKLAKKILIIEGMHCSSCAFLIDSDLEELNGVNSVNTSFAKSVCEIEFDEEKIDLGKIVATVEKTGYVAKN